MVSALSNSGATLGSRTANKNRFKAVFVILNTMNENAPESNQPEDKSRRKFLQGMLAGAVVTVPGTMQVNKYMEHEQEMENLAKEFLGKEEDFVSANKAAIYLLNEMEKKNTDAFQFGDGKESDRVRFLVGFLERHLKSSVGYQYPFRQEILVTRLDRRALMQILGWSEQIIRTPSRKGKVGTTKTVV